MNACEVSVCVPQTEEMGNSLVLLFADSWKLRSLKLRKAELVAMAENLI